MRLYEQMIALGYHLIVGQLFGLFFSFLSICCIPLSRWIRIIFYTFFSVLCTCLYYYYFYEVLLPIFYIVIRPFKKQMRFAKNKICVIMNKQRDKRRRKAQKNEQKKNIQKT